MVVAVVGVSEDVLQEFRVLVFHKYQKFGFLRTEVDKALNKHIEALKQELEATQGASD